MPPLPERGVHICSARNARREAAGQGKEVGEERCGQRAACGGIAALSGRRAALSKRALANEMRSVPLSRVRPATKDIDLAQDVIDERPEPSKADSRTARAESGRSSRRASQGRDSSASSDAISRIPIASTSLEIG